MPNYVITYLGGNPPATPEEGQKQMQDYRQWLADLGDAAVSPMNPLRDMRTVHPDGSVTTGGSTSMSGYTVIEADSIDAAVRVAQACPFLSIGGALEVSELVNMAG